MFYSLGFVNTDSHGTHVLRVLSEIHLDNISLLINFTLATVQILPLVSHDNIIPLKAFYLMCYFLYNVP